MTPLATATSPFTASALLEELAAAGYDLAVVRNPACPPYLLHQFVSERPGLRIFVAKHARTSRDTLRLLASDVDARVRATAARHPHMPAGVLATLAGDDDFDVRASVASHQSTPAATLEALSSDHHSGIRAAVRANPRTPAHVRAYLALGNNVRPPARYR